MIIDVFQTLQTGSVAQVESDCFHDETVGGVFLQGSGDPFAVPGGAGTTQQRRKG
jgi:hypothetical protein